MPDAPEPGWPQQQIPDGQRALNTLRSAGFKPDEIMQYQQQKSQILLRAGFQQSDVDNYWGNAAPASPTVEQHVQGNMWQQALDDFTGPIQGAWQGLENQQRQNWQHVFHPTQMDQISPAGTQLRGALTMWDALNVVWSPLVGAVNAVVGGPGGRWLASQGAPAPHVTLDLKSPDSNIFDPTQWVVNPELVQGDQAGQIYGNIITGLATIGITEGARRIGGGPRPAAPETTRQTAAAAFRRGEITDPQHALTVATGGLPLDPSLRSQIPNADAYARTIMQLGVRDSVNARLVGGNMMRIWARTGAQPAEIAAEALRDPVKRQELFTQTNTGDTRAPTFGQRQAIAAPSFTSRPQAGTMEEIGGTPAPGAEAGGVRPTRPFGQRPNAEIGPWEPPRPMTPTFTGTIDQTLGVFRQLEGSGDQSVSPAGAVGRYQILPQTARDYGFDPTKLKDPVYNTRVATAIIGDLQKRYNGNLEAMAVAYNAGTRHADAFLAAGPGTRLEAYLDPSTRGGVRYARVPSVKDESGLPLETQHYLANLRRHQGGFNEMPATGAREEHVQAMDTAGRERLDTLRANPQHYFDSIFGRRTTITSAERSAAAQEEQIREGRTTASPNATEHSEANFRAGFGAWDLKVAGMTNQEVIARLKASGLPYDQLIEEGDHVHIGFGPRTRGQVFAMRGGRLAPGEAAAGAEGTEGAVAPASDQRTQTLQNVEAAAEQQRIGGDFMDRPDGEPVPSYSFSLSSASAYEGAPIEDIDRGILESIGEQPDVDWRKSLANYPDEAMDKLFAINPARRLDSVLTGAKLLDRDTEFGIEDAFRQTFASDNRAEVFVRYGAIDGPEGKNIIPGSNSLMDVVKELKRTGGTADGFRAYLMAERTVTKAAQGIDTGVNPFASRAKLSNAEDVAKYKKAADIWTGVFNSSLDYAQGSGRFSAAQIAAMKELNPVYASFRRIMGDDKSFNAKSGYGFTLGNPLKRMEGSDRQIVDPLVASVDNMRLVVASADQNWARGHVIELAENDPRLAAALGLRRADVPKMQESQAVKILEPYRDQMTSDEFEKAVEALSPIAEARADSSLGKSEFAYYRDGQREVWHVDDPDFAQMMKGSLTREETGLITQVMSKFAALDRLGITIMPDFPARNIISHQIIQFINDPSHPPPFLAPIKGLFSAVKLDEVYQNAMAKGALGAALVDVDRDYLARDMDSLFHEGGIKDRLWNYASSPLEAARILQERGDVANRIGLYQRFVDQGLDPQKAAMRARTAGIDYGERLGNGAVRWWSRTTPFFKARLLYLKQAGEAWGAHPVKAALYATLAVSLPTVIVWAINRWQDQFLPEDQKSTNIPRWDKDYGLPLPQTGGARVRVRYPEGTGAPFGAMVYRLLDAMAAHDPHAMDNWTDTFIKQLPLEGPPAIQAPLENMANFNVMTGNQLVPDSLKHMPETEWQYTANTTPMAKTLGAVLDPALRAMHMPQLSPIAIDHLTQSWTGTGGMRLAHILGIPFQPEARAGDWANNPFVESFFARNPGMSGQVVDDFYTEKDRFDEAMQLRTLARRDIRGDVNDPGLIAKAREDHELAALDQRLNRVSGALTLTTTVIRGVAAAKMEPAEKQKFIDALTAQGVALARTSTAVMRTVEDGSPAERQAALRDFQASATSLEGTIAQVRQAEGLR